jgi:hypothetical protein
MKSVVIYHLCLRLIKLLHILIEDNEQCQISVWYYCTSSNIDTFSHVHLFLMIIHRKLTQSFKNFNINHTTVDIE